jgi:hypothetical protein
MQRRRHGIDEYRQRLRYFLDLLGLTRKAGERLPYKTGPPGLVCYSTTTMPEARVLPRSLEHKRCPHLSLTKWRSRMSPYRTSSIDRPPKTDYFAQVKNSLRTDSKVLPAALNLLPSLSTAKKPSTVVLFDLTPIAFESSTFPSSGVPIRSTLRIHPGLSHV